VHSAEIEYALGNLATNDVYAWAPADDSASAALEGYFANFVKTLDPNGAGLPTWPAAYAGDTVRVMILDALPHAAVAPHEQAHSVGTHLFYRYAPGGQIELSGEQCETIHCAYREFAIHVRQLIDLTRALGDIARAQGVDRTGYRLLTTFVFSNIPEFKGQVLCFHRHSSLVPQVFHGGPLFSITFRLRSYIF
jgi:hypothetical protein